MRHRITLQNKSITVNKNGFKVEDWEDIKTVWASVSNLRGREYYAAAAVQAENTVKFIIRYTKDIDTGMQIVFNEKAYNILSIDNDQYKNRFIEIRAQEVDLSG